MLASAYLPWLTLKKLAIHHWQWLKDYSGSVIGQDCTIGQWPVGVGGRLTHRTKDTAA
jgi:hypothetical protein